MKENDLDDELTPEEKKEADEVADAYGADSKSYEPLSMEGYVLLLVIGSLFFTMLNAVVFTPPSHPALISNTSPIDISNGNGNATVLHRGNAGYNQTLAEMNQPQISEYQQQTQTARSAETVFLLLVFVGFFYSYRYITTSTKKSWLIYVFIFTSMLGWGALLGVISLMLGLNVDIGVFGGFGGLYFAYWKLQDKGFTDF